jgi:hypothetical protein
VVHFAWNKAPTELSHVRVEATEGVEGVASAVDWVTAAVGLGSSVAVAGTVGVTVGAGVAVCGTKTTTVGACRSTVVSAVFSAFTNPYTPSNMKSARTAATGR